MSAFLAFGRLNAAQMRTICAALTGSVVFLRPISIKQSKISDESAAAVGDEAADDSDTGDEDDEDDDGDEADAADDEDADELEEEDDEEAVRAAIDAAAAARVRNLMAG